MNTTLCGVKLSKNHALKLARSIYDILILSPIRKQDISSIKELRQYLIENNVIKGVI